jgi:hypothetical protein
MVWWNDEGRQVGRKCGASKGRVLVRAATYAVLFIAFVVTSPDPRVLRPDEAGNVIQRHEHMGDFKEP